MDLQNVIGLVLVVFLCIACLYLWQQNSKLRLALQEIKDTPRPDRPQSIELSEFLYDQSRYGYSFVRVDPAAIMLRSPRDLR